MSAKPKAPRHITVKGHRYVRADYMSAISVAGGELQFDGREVTMTFQGVKGVVGLGYEDATKLLQSMVGKRVRAAYQPGNRYGTLVILIK